MIKSGLYKLLDYPKARRIGLSVYVLYFFLYQWSIGYFKITSSSLFKWTLVPNWVTLISKRISTFLFEGIGILELLGVFRWIIAPGNILFAFILADLVFINIACVIYMQNQPKQCRLDTNYNGLIAILPSFLTGFACCAPTFLIPLASLIGGGTAMISQGLQWLFPLSVILLLYGAYKGLKQVSLT